MLRDLAKSLDDMWRSFTDAFDPYRPELHYMRGPGPKWRAKRTGVVEATGPDLPAGAEARA